jgi:hypothetical protein
MKDMLWIEDIVQCTLAPPFLTNSKVNMVGFVDLHKVVALRSAFLAFQDAQNRVELKGGTKSEGLNCQFSQVKGDSDLQEISKPVPIPNKKAKKKKKKKKRCVKKKMKKIKKLEIISIMCNKKIKRFFFLKP